MEYFIFQKLIRYERTVENLNGRVKNISKDSKDAAIIAKLEQTVNIQVKEIDNARETLAAFEAREIKLKKRIPCEEKPCPKGRKQCQYSHDLEYKKPTDRDTKQELCKYFAGKGCNLDEKDCRFSHSMELLAKVGNRVAATGSNQIPLGQRTFDNTQYIDSDDNTNGPPRFRKVTEGANNNMSVEITDDLSSYPANDARRTLQNRSNGLYK